MTTPLKMNKANWTKQSKKPSLLSKNTWLPKTPSSPFVRRCIKCVQNTVHQFSLWHTGEHLLVGVSGGADSVCLLDILSLLAPKYAFTLSIAHVNYHLRGHASDLDERHVKTLAEKYHLPCFILSHKTKPDASEETLRDIRYAFFEKLRKKIGAQHIVIAHNQDDQAETLLLRLLRGSGLSGLAAMRPKNNYIIRPLIEMSRADILQYLHDRHIAFRNDRSNTDVRYLRNRIRHKLIPYLEKNFQPQTKKLFAETALLLGDDYAFLEQHSPSFLLTQTPNTTLSRTALLQLPDTLLRHTIRAMLRPLLTGNNPSKNLVNEIVKTLKSNKNKSQTITFKGLKFIRKGDTVRLLHFE